MTRFLRPLTSPETFMSPLFSLVDSLPLTPSHPLFPFPPPQACPRRYYRPPVGPGTVPLGWGSRSDRRAPPKAAAAPGAPYTRVRVETEDETADYDYVIE